MAKPIVSVREVQLQLENQQLLMRLTEAEDALDAIRNGDVDAIVVNALAGEQIFTLNTSETPYRIIVEEMYEGAIILSSTGLILYCNSRFAEMISHPIETIMGANLGSFFNSTDLPLYNQLLNDVKNKNFVYELKMETNTGVIYLHLSFSSLPKNVLGDICVMAVDITELKMNASRIIELNTTLEEKVQERTAQFEAANSELEAFSYSVSHDLRAPLRAIGGYTQIFFDDFLEGVPPEGKEALINIKNATRKMGKLIDELLAFSKLGRKSLNKIHIDMNQLVEKVVSDIKKSTPHKAIIKIKNLPLANGDYTLLYQVIYNLISNAIKYSATMEHPVVEIFSKVKNSANVYVIKDNGAGFDMRFSGKLFGVFQRLHSESEFEGNGVGLAIVQRIVNKHGGSIWGDGKINGGATFYFTLSPIDK